MRSDIYVGMEVVNKNGINTKILQILNTSNVLVGFEGTNIRKVYNKSKFLTGDTSDKVIVQKGKDFVQTHLGEKRTQYGVWAEIIECHNDSKMVTVRAESGQIKRAPYSQFASGTVRFNSKEHRAYMKDKNEKICLGEIQKNTLGMQGKCIAYRTTGSIDVLVEDGDTITTSLSSFRFGDFLPKSLKKLYSLENTFYYLYKGVAVVTEPKWSSSNKQLIFKVYHLGNELVMTAKELDRIISAEKGTGKYIFDLYKGAVKVRQCFNLDFVYESSDIEERSIVIRCGDCVFYTTPKTFRNGLFRPPVGGNLRRLQDGTYKSPDFDYRIVDMTKEKGKLLVHYITNKGGIAKIEYNKLLSMISY